MNSDATTVGAIEFALRGLAQRADVRANNLSNVNTPGFRAASVDFESVLREALDGQGSLASLRADVDVAPNLPGPQPNTVSMEDEMIGQLKDNLMRQAMVNAFNAKMNAMRTAMGTR